MHATDTEHVPQDYEAITQQIRTAVLCDVESFMTEKIADLWKRGNQRFQSMQSKHKESLEKLAQEVSACSEMQRLLEMENEQLRQEVTHLAGKFSRTAPGPGRYRTTEDFADGRPDPPFNLMSESPPYRCAGVESYSVFPEPSKVGQVFPQHIFESPVSMYSPGSKEKADEMTVEGYASGTDASFPFSDIPPFPFFPGPTNSVATPLLLADALGTQTPSRTPISLASSLTSKPGTTKTRNTFSFMLRKADGAQLGLELSHEHQRALRVEAIHPGAVEAWNRQCAGRSSSDKAVFVGDRIVSVNDVSGDSEKMMDECRNKILLKFCIVRERSQSTPPGCTFSFRADASEFVPMQVSTDPSSAVRPDLTHPVLQRV